MTDNAPTRAVLTDALGRLTRDDVPGMEFLVLQQVMGWIFSEDNPGAGYDRRHASLLGGALFAGLDDAATITLDDQPTETATIGRARDRLVEGAHELASHGEAGLDMVIEVRIIPAMLGELEPAADDRTLQGACAWAHLLYAIAMGERQDQDEQILAGFLESFDAWSALLAAR